jgi:ATP-binding cassette subfamily B protein
LATKCYIVLISRFWDVSNGSITIGGINLKEMDSETLMDKVSFVFQDVYLFNDTIANNIRMGNSQANMEMVIEAAKAAQIHDFIMSLENGYDTKPGDRGIRLSGGERQRITIARAILRNTPIVVLDEATSFADPENEQAIIQAIASLTEGKTVISIAHRLSTITNVDQIVVLDKGQVLEKGHHNDLISNNGTYSNLWKKYSDIHSLKIRRTV